MDIKIKIEKPPVWDSVCATFNVEPKNVFFTYANTIYNPDEVDIPDDIIEHEKIHMLQQMRVRGEMEDMCAIERVWGEEEHYQRAGIWWGRYLREPKFRLHEETEAYGTQYRFLCNIVKDRNARNILLMRLAKSLSGPLYDSCVSFKKAMGLIKQASRVR